MDRSTEFSRVVEIFRSAGPSEAAIEHGDDGKPPLSQFLTIALRVNSNLEGSKVLMDKMSILADRKEFSNDPTSEIGEISEVFNSKAQQVQRDLTIMKKSSSRAYGFNGDAVGGAQQQQHFKLILESLNKKQSTQLTTFQTSMKKHASNVEMRNKRVGKYGVAASISGSALESGKSIGGPAKAVTHTGSGEAKETYAMFANTGPVLRPSTTQRAQNQRIVQGSHGGNALPQSSPLLPVAGSLLSPSTQVSHTLENSAAPPGVISTVPTQPMNTHNQNETPHSQTQPNTWHPSTHPSNIPPPAPAPVTVPAGVPFYSHPEAVARVGLDQVSESSMDRFGAGQEYRPVSTYTSRRRPRGGGGHSVSTGSYQDQYNHGYGDSAYEGGDRYENPKMAQQKRDRSRLKGAEKVEAALAQMGSLFTQVASMVVEQGEVLTRIEDDVENGLEEVKLGHQQMERFWEISKQGRGVIVTLIVVTVVFVVFFLYIR